MTRMIPAAIAVSLLLSAARLMTAPFDIATLGVATFLLYRLVGAIADRGAARLSVVLLGAWLVPVLAGRPAANVPLSALDSLSLPWWLPLIVGATAIAGIPAQTRRTAIFLTIWWTVSAAIALSVPPPLSSVASAVETAPAAALAALAISRLADMAWRERRRRSHLLGTLAASCLWQAWLVIGTGRPARVLVPMLAAALMIATTDLLTEDDGREREAVGAALVLAMLVLGLVPGARALVAQQQAVARSAALAAAGSGAEAPSSIAGP